MIEGVAVKESKVLADNRGFLMDMHRSDEPLFVRFGQAYITGCRKGMVRGWHYHKEQTDHFICVSGRAPVVWYDTANALLGLPLPVYGVGQYRPNWIHVRGHCRAINAVQHHGMAWSVYNVGDGHELANVELVERIVDLLHLPVSLIHFVADGPGHDRRYAVNDDKLRALGYQPVTLFDDGIAEMIPHPERKKEHSARGKARGHPGAQPGVRNGPE